MKRSTIPTLIFVFLILFVIALAQTLNAPSESPTPSVVVVVTPTLGPTPTATPLPGVITRGLIHINNWYNGGVRFAVAFATLIASVAAIYLGFRALLGLWRLVRRPTQLVVENFSNATSDDTLNNVAAGLGHDARAELVHALATVHRVIERHRGQLLGEYQPPVKAPVPEGALDQKLPDYIKSFQDVAPGPAKTVLQLISAVFQPRGVKVSSYLRRHGDTPGILGISYDIGDLQNQQEPTLYTIWESSFLPIPGERPNLVPTPAPTDDKEVVALYKMGRMYEARGVWDEAQSQYLEALKKQPSYSLAEQALERVLAQRKTLEERYHRLLKHTTPWLAIEWARWSMITYKPRTTSDMSVAYHAKVHNFIGAIHMSYAQTHDAAAHPMEATFFYQLAVKDFETAIKCVNNWYQPYENLGDTFSIMGKNRENNTEIQIKALNYYNQALQLVHTSLPTLSEETAEEREMILRRIQVGRAVAKILTDNDTYTREAIQDVKQAEQGWDISSYVKYSRFLYNLAAWYAVAYELKIGVENARKTALYYLGYSLGQDPSLRYHASKDIDLSSLRQEVKELTARLDQRLPKGRSKDENFDLVIKEILQEVAEFRPI